MFVVTCCLPSLFDLRGHSSKMEVLRNSTRSRPYSTCWRVSMNLKTNSQAGIDFS